MTFIPPIPNIVSDASSSSTPLAGGATFTGAAISLLEVGTICVSVTADQQGTTHIDQSSDAVNWDLVTSFVHRAGPDGDPHCTPVVLRFGRIRYTNTSSSPQIVFRMQTLLAPVGSAQTPEVQTVEFLSTDRDAFGRLRVSTPTTLLDMKFQDSRGLNENAELTTGNGVVNYTIGLPQVGMRVTGDGAGRVVRQTRRYVTYQPGKGLLVICSGNLSDDSSVVGVISRMGLFDSKADKTAETGTTSGDGFFARLAHGASPTLSFVHRTSNNPTFTETDTIVAQPNWNVDPLDGEGPSRFTLNPASRNMLWIAEEWLGSGGVEMGFVLDNRFVLCHEFDFANEPGATVAFTSRSSLPIRYEISSAGTGAATNVTLTQICATGIVEGDFTPQKRIFSASTGFTGPDGTNTELPLIAIRLRSDRVRHVLDPLELSSINEGAKQNLLLRVYRFIAPESQGDGPLGVAMGSPAWIDSSTDLALFESAAEYNVDATTFDAGAGGVAYLHERVYEVFLTIETVLNLTTLTNRILVEADIEGNSDWIVVTIEADAAMGSAIDCSITWQEFV